MNDKKDVLKKLKILEKLYKESIYKNSLVKLNKIYDLIKKDTNNEYNYGIMRITIDQHVNMLINSINFKKSSNFTKDNLKLLFNEAIKKLNLLKRKKILTNSKIKKLENSIKDLKKKLDNTKIKMITILVTVFIKKIDNLIEIDNFFNI
jgi:hypothetical protein